MQDENDIFILRSDESVNKYLDRPKAHSIEDARQFITKIKNAVSNHQSLYWAITLKESAAFAGTICVWNISEENKKAEIGYELLPRFQGKGIMQEALQRILKFAFENMKLTSIEANTHKDNHHSSKLLEKLHFKQNSGSSHDGNEINFFLKKQDQ